MKNKGIILGVVIVLVIIGVIFFVNKHNTSNNQQNSNGEDTLVNIIEQPADANDKVKNSLEQK